nr:hypothetical protein [Tanacetum cinerariifolium]
IGYKNPLCLTRAKQAQLALYNGHEILKDNHAPAKVHNTEDTLEIAAITRKKMNAKMTNPEYVTHKVKIAPHDYSKENLLATFTPHKQLTPEQIYWSNDLMKLKSEALKERAKASRPIKAFTVYPPNTPATLIPKVLPIKKVFSVASNFKLNVARFAKMHVANTSVEARCLALEAELATLRDKSHQENQGELIKHFSNLEVDHLNLQLKYQNLKDGIGNNPPTPDKDTLDFDSVFVIGKMQASLQGKDNAIRQLKKQLSKLQVTSSDTERTVKVRTIDSQLTKITRAKHIEQVTKLTVENMTLKTSVSKAKVQPPVLTRTKHAVDVEPIVPHLRNNKDAHLYYLRHLKESVEPIRDIVEEAKVKIKQVWKPKHVERKMKQVWKPKQVGKVWKPTGKVLTTIGHQWRPTCRILHLGKQCPLTRFTPPQVVSVAQNKKQARTYANQMEPNHNWGSKVSNVQSLSGFKCRSYRSSFGI